jgi:hypothetical protein
MSNDNKTGLAAVTIAPDAMEVKTGAKCLATSFRREKQNRNLK